ncbi:hypothetical protein MJO29_003625 [Puccinia striiformis f. sp. tritici]|nr:hypothetical protein MJO29_003625 [Puccinia striiformis f. sp. tritici]
MPESSVKNALSDGRLIRIDSWIHSVTSTPQGRLARASNTSDTDPLRIATTDDRASVMGRGDW